MESMSFRGKSFQRPNGEMSRSEALVLGWEWATKAFISVVSVNLPNGPVRGILVHPFH